MSSKGMRNDKLNRIALFVISFILLFVVFKFATGDYTPQSDIFVVLFSSLVMLSFITLFLEHFYTKPTDVLASTISIILLLSPLLSQTPALLVCGWYSKIIAKGVQRYRVKLLRLS